MNLNYADKLSGEAKSKLTLSEVENLSAAFAQFEADGEVPPQAFSALVSALGDKFGSRETFERAFSNFRRSSLNFNDLASLYLTCSIAKKKDVVQQRGAGDSLHSFSEEEKQGYIEYINSVLSSDSSLSTVIPIDLHGADIFNVIGQGVILVKLINRGFPNAISEGKLKTRPANDYQKNENHDLCIQGAKDIGCSVVNIGGKDLLAGTPHLVLGLVWQIIKKSLLAQVAANLQAEGSVPIDMPPEQILLRWFNYHLQNAGCDRVVTNWSNDLKDSEMYAVLLSQLEPAQIAKHDVQQVRNETDLHERAETMLGFADRLGCRKFLTPKEVVLGNPRLNLAFVATLFNKYPRMGPSLDEKKVVDLEKELKDAREGRDIAFSERDGLHAQLRKRGEELEQKTRDLDDISHRLQEAIASRDQLKQTNTHLEGLLEERNQENAKLSRTIEQLNADKDKLQSRLDEERNLHEQTRIALSQLEAKLAATVAQAEERERALRADIEREKKEKEEFKALLQKTQEELERTRREAAERQAALEALLAAEREKNAQLQAQINALLKENEELRAKLRDEQQLRANLEEELRETEEELEEVRAEADEEKTLLLQRIKDLEEELEQLKQLMENSLDKAAREKAEALSAAARAKEQALSEAEQARLAQLRKVQGLLAKVQREGDLYVEEKSALLGTYSYKKRYFVLQDVFLSYYKDKKAFEQSKPLGIIRCDQVRVYEQEGKEGKRQFTFQLAAEPGKGKDFNLAANKADEMKNWMKDIKEAKKKAMGVGIVAHGIGNDVPASPRSPRPN